MSKAIVSGIGDECIMVGLSPYPDGAETAGVAGVVSPAWLMVSRPSAVGRAAGLWHPFHVL